MSEVKFAKALAANTDLDTAQPFIFQRDNTFFGVLISAQGDDCFTVTRQIGSELEDQFFESDSKLAERLSNCLNLFKEKLSVLTEVNILLFALSEEHILYLQGVGNHKSFIKRGEGINPISPVPLDGQLLSGYLELGDQLLFVSSSFTDDLVKLFHSGIEGLEGEVESSIIGKESILPVAAILIDYSAAEETIVEPVIPNLEDQIPSQSRFNMPDLEQIKSFLRRSLPKSRRGRLYLGSALFLIVIIGIIISARNKADAAKNAQFDTLLTSAKNEFDQAENLKDLDATQAQDYLNKSKKDVDSALALKSDDKDAKDLKNRIDQSSNDILKVYRVSNFPVFLDLNLIKSGFSSSKISLSVGKVLLLDTNQKTLVEVDLSKKTNQILAGETQLGSPLYASLNGDFAYVYSEKGITRVDTKALKADNVVKTDPDWGRIEDISAFGGNIYLLDGIKNQIWKYTPAATGFSDKLTYLKDNSKTDFAGGKRMLIDSSVWVLKTGPEIDKYTSGVPDSFNIGGLDKPLKEVTAFFVSDETDNIYLLDSGNSRLVVLKKGGQYVSQYQGDKFKVASDLVVDEKGKKIYLLGEGKIYQIDLH